MPEEMDQSALVTAKFYGDMAKIVAWCSPKKSRLTPTSDWIIAQ